MNITLKVNDSGIRKISSRRLFTSFFSCDFSRWKSCNQSTISLWNETQTLWINTASRVQEYIRTTFWAQRVWPRFSDKSTRFIFISNLKICKPKKWDFSQCMYHLHWYFPSLWKSPKPLMVKLQYRQWVRIERRICSVIYVVVYSFLISALNRFTFAMPRSGLSTLPVWPESATKYSKI